MMTVFWFSNRLPSVTASPFSSLTSSLETAAIVSPVGMSLGDTLMSDALVRRYLWSQPLLLREIRSHGRSSYDCSPSPSGPTVAILNDPWLTSVNHDPGNPQTQFATINFITERPFRWSITHPPDAPVLRLRKCPQKLQSCHVESIKTPRRHNRAVHLVIGIREFIGHTAVCRSGARTSVWRCLCCGWLNLTFKRALASHKARVGDVRGCVD